MLFATFVCFLAALATAVSAAPLQSRQSKTFRLKTTGAHDPQHNDLYVYAYHTGAGFNDAVLTPDVSKAVQFSLNGTSLQYDLGQGFTWGVNMAPDTNYAGE